MIACSYSYSEKSIPCHPCFYLVANCEQVLSTYVSRRLITLEKYRQPADVPVRMRHCPLSVWPFFFLYDAFAVMVKLLR